MNKKKIIIVSFSVLIITTIIIAFYIMKKNKKIENDNLPEDKNTSVLNNDNIEQAKDVNNVKIVKMKVTQNGNQVIIISTIKNISNIDISSFSITIALFDDKNNKITDINADDDKIIKPNEEYSFENYYNLKDENIKITYAKVTSLIPNYKIDRDKEFERYEKEMEEMERNMK